MEGPKFEDRAEAGRRLAEALREAGGAPDGIVLALPRGGVPVGLEVARALDLPLDVFLVQKLELAGEEAAPVTFGAIASGGVRVLEEAVIGAHRIGDEVIASAAAQAQQELERQERAYRAERPEPELAGRTVVLVDDGLVTGSTMRAAVVAVRAREPARIVVAVPVASRAACERLRGLADQVICLYTPGKAGPFGAWYKRFEELDDATVRELLSRADASMAQSLPHRRFGL